MIAGLIIMFAGLGEFVLPLARMLSGVIRKEPDRLAGIRS
jgi:hypothetical protein